MKLETRACDLCPGSFHAVRKPGRCGGALLFSKTLDALGIRPDASYLELEPDLRDALVVGLPIADA